ncbi:DUF1461 domain-containing protein [Candidatus Dojkabacteria bacterium]|uniref:DUF1461 domain-containing protein n=1 Tax=Candidatus Dojkabacteria bacterium TaxID=2099670 RepID=A0A955L6T0_9BACT|nr:DUF1461 domain-containing protein [Candidatus Dojkabacteria bacterium]
MYNQIKRTKLLKYIFTISSSVCLTLAITIAIILYATYDVSFYTKQFEELGITEYVEFSTAEESIKNILKFLSHREELDRTRFNQNEFLHLQDVQNILDTAMVWGVVLFTIGVGDIIGYSLLVKTQESTTFGNVFSEHIIRVLSVCGMLILGSLMALGISYLLFDFDHLFIWFHEVFFTDNYAFDPKKSLMKAILPDELFFAFTIRIAWILFGSGLLLLGTKLIQTNQLYIEPPSLKAP